MESLETQIEINQDATIDALNELVATLESENSMLHQNVALLEKESVKKDGIIQECMELIKKYRLDSVEDLEKLNEINNTLRNI